MKKFLILFLCLFLAGCTPQNNTTTNSNTTYSKFVTEIKNNEPDLDKNDGKQVFETYSELDSLGRCGEAYANICKKIMPTEDRGEIGQIKPTGWHTVKYDCVDGKYLYNRCHLIAFCLAGENDNEKNLITGTRQFNVEGMLPYEERVLNYVNSTNHHVLYKVTPVYTGDNLVADGVKMQALSVEDDNLKFNVFVKNIQDGVVIDYKTGESRLDNDVKGTSNVQKETSYIINTNTRKFHKQDCSALNDTKAKNKKTTSQTKDELIKSGYSPCKLCIG